MAMQQEDTLEEMWRIKREIAEEYPTWEYGLRKEAKCCKAVVLKIWYNS